MLDNDEDRAREIAVAYVDYAPRTCAEVRRRLARAQFEQKTIDAVVERLVEAGLLDDTAFSMQWIESRVRTRGYGTVRLRSELLARGVAREIADAAIEGVSADDELGNALAAARKYVGTGGCSGPAERRRLAGFLQRRGYNWDLIQQVLAAVTANDR